MRPNILHDQTGQLGRIQPVVARDYALRPWVRKRVDHARAQTEEILTWLDRDALLHDQVYIWLLSLFGLSHMVLVAGLDQPTFRKALANTGRILTRYGHSDLHERLLAWFGCGSTIRERATSLMAACAGTNMAAPILRTPFFGSTNITHVARPIAIDGGYEVIESGAHRESLIWTTLIHTWCHKALHNDAEADLREAYAGSYAALLDELGIGSPEDVQARMAQLEELIPEVHAVAEQIVVANPDVRNA